MTEVTDKDSIEPMHPETPTRHCGANAYRYETRQNVKTVTIGDERIEVVRVVDLDGETRVYKDIYDVRVVDHPALEHADSESSATAHRPFIVFAATVEGNYFAPDSESWTFDD